MCHTTTTPGTYVSRRLAAAKHFGSAFTDATPAAQRSMVASDELRLIVTLDADAAHKDTIFESHLDFGRVLIKEGLLDTWVLFDEHTSTIAAANAYAGERDDIISIVPQDQARFAIDPRTGVHWGSSAIIRKIIGSSAA